VKIRFVLFLYFIAMHVVFSQDEEILVVKDSVAQIDMYEAALRPSKAGFYSAILPGLGQYYNKTYWKIPVVYAALGTSAYFQIWNNKRYHEYRDIFKAKKINASVSELSLETLERAQKYHRKKRDLFMMITVGTYVLQAVWASVDAHLEYHNTNKELSLTPIIIQEPLSQKSGIGAGLTFNF